MNKELIHLLFSYDVDLNIQDNEGKTPLHYAVVRGPRFMDLIEKIVEKGADFTIKDKKGKTPLDIASDAGHKNIVELFQKKKFP
jgi:ankyrin repeat protein